MENEYDLAVIGAGPGGYVAAIRAAQLGLKTICIDKRDVPGGTCLNVGCIPSKALLQSTELLYHLQTKGKELGIEYSQLTYNFEQMSKRKEAIIRGLVDSVANQFKGYKVTFAKGEARFISPNELEIISENSSRINAKNILLATGSEPISLSDLEFDEKQILSSTGALYLSKIPSRMTVIGGGIIGVEIASIYKRLGTDVTIVEMLDHICPTMDESVSRGLLQILKKQGIKFLLSSKVITTVKQPDEVILMVQEGENLSNLSSDVVLVSVGRRPFTKGLNLEKIGISISAKGFIDVDCGFRTNHSHIFAIGDLIEGPMLAHKASAEGIAVVDSLVGKETSVNYLAIPNVVYTSPEVACVGLTEEEAKKSHLEIIKGNVSFKGNPRARCMDDMDGFVKVIGEAHSGRLVGMHIVGPHASELIEEGMIAIEKKCTIRELALAPNAHPTLSEAIKDACMMALGE